MTDQRTPHVYQRVNALTEDQRTQAQAYARKRIAGGEPKLADFERTAFVKYPPQVVNWINRMAEAVMFAAFVPSALRIFIAALSAFASGVPSEPASVVVGLTSILLAEVGQIVFMLARATAEEGRRWLAVGAAICTAYAIVGNAQIAEPWAHTSAFAWLEAFGPPVLVLIAAHVRKTQILTAVESRHEAQRSYVDALNAWQASVENAHEHRSWMRVYANALKDAFRSVDKRKTAQWLTVTDDEWALLIERELQADRWYEAALERIAGQAQQLDAQRIDEEVRLRIEPIIADYEERIHALRVSFEERIRQMDDEREERIDGEVRSRMNALAPVSEARVPSSGASGGRKTGATDGHVTQGEDGIWNYACPHCPQIGKGYGTQDGAVNALGAHLGRWCPVLHPKETTHSDAAQSDALALEDVRLTAAQAALASAEPEPALNGAGGGS